MVPKDATCLSLLLPERYPFLFFKFFSKNSKMLALQGILETKWSWNFKKLLQITQIFFFLMNGEVLHIMLGEEAGSKVVFIISKNTLHMHDILSVSYKLCRENVLYHLHSEKNAVF